MVEDLEDPRRHEPPYVLGERDMLEAWLEFHRTTLVLKCEGIDDAARKRRPVPTSLLSLHGLVRHMAEVERNWFHRVLRRSRTRPSSGPTPGIDDVELIRRRRRLVGRPHRLARRSARSAVRTPRPTTSMTPASDGARPCPCGGSTTT